MAINSQQKLDLLSRARDNWLNAESTALAYERALKSAKQRSEWLKIGTILSALLTTASGFASRPVITIVTGLLTTALATAERLYAPTENYQKYWGCRTELLGVKETLVTFSITIDAVDDLMKGAQPLDQFAQQIVAITQKMPVTTEDGDMHKAREAFRLATMAQMITRAEREAGTFEEPEQETMMELPEDAPDVVPAYRPRIQKVRGIQI
jgi:hypothetical protein